MEFLSQIEVVGFDGRSTDLVNYPQRRGPSKPPQHHHSSRQLGIGDLGRDHKHLFVRHLGKSAPQKPDELVQPNGAGIEEIPQHGAH